MNHKNQTISTTCLINNYNYEQFISEAINSALNQSVKFDEIIVVDDASTDNSAKIITKIAEQENIKYILKEKNQGQLSSFNAGVLAATGDLIFFLDADDIYEFQYLENAINFYQSNPECDFLFCAYRKFGAAEGLFQHDESDCDLGYSVLKTFYLNQWIGSITSTLSMRKEIALKILPIPYLDDWRVRADDCLVWSSSLVGAKKFYLAQPLVRYRIHASNNFSNINITSSHFDDSFEYRRALKRSAIFNYVMNKNSISVPLPLAYTAICELKTIPFPSESDFVDYFKVIFVFESKIYWKLKGIYLLFVYFCKVANNKKSKNKKLSKTNFFKFKT